MRQHRTLRLRGRPGRVEQLHQVVVADAVLFMRDPALVGRPPQHVVLDRLIAQ